MQQQQQSQQQSGDVAAVVAAADWCSCNRLVHDGRLCIGSRTILSRRRGRGWRVARSHSAPAGSHPTRRAAAPPAGACTRGTYKGARSHTQGCSTKAGSYLHRIPYSSRSPCPALHSHFNRPAHRHTDRPSQHSVPQQRSQVVAGNEGRGRGPLTRGRGGVNSRRCRHRVEDLEAKETSHL